MHVVAAVLVEFSRNNMHYAVGYDNGSPIDPIGSTLSAATLLEGCNAASFEETAAVSLDQYAFRFYEDDGSESGSTAAAAEDTNITAGASETKRLRIGIDATADPAAAQFKLQYRRDGSTGDWRDIS